MTFRQVTEKHLIAYMSFDILYNCLHKDFGILDRWSSFNLFICTQPHIRKFC